MPRQSIDLTKFDVGLVTNPDQEDIPLEAQNAGSQNIDVLTQGKLKGVPKPLSASLHGYDGQTFGWINRSDGKWDLIYSDNSTIRVIYDFYGTQTTATLANVKAETIISNNQEVHIGCGTGKYPQWIGYISHGQFGGSPPDSIQIINNNIVSPSSADFLVEYTTINTTTTESDAIFPQGTEYEYAISLVYDGYQESPLSQDTFTYQIKSLITGIDIRITAYAYASLNNRVTGVKLYRRERMFYDSTIYSSMEAYLTALASRNMPYSKAASKALRQLQSQQYSDTFLESGELGGWGEYKLIADLDINANTIASPITSAGWITSGSNKYIMIKDTNKAGSSYYSQVGISETYNDTITSYTMAYGLSAMANNMLFIADANYGNELTSSEAGHMIFRSLPYRYDTFNWVDEKLILPSQPKAMKSHRGKLYVWDENTTYIIDPISFQIEKVITGRGCSSQKSVVETDYGLFWANKNGVYWSTQTEELIQPTKDNLTEPILSIYQTAVAVATPILTYNSGRNQLLVHVYDDIYAYNTVERRWDFYPDYKLVSQEEVCGAFIGKNGETYTVTDNDLYKDFADTNRKPWIYITKEFTLDDPSQEKKFYKIIRDSVGTFLWKYSLNGGTTWITFSSEDLSILRGKSIMLYVSGLDTTSTVDSISILCRRLEGKR